MANPQKLRWLIAHQPAYLFVRTAEAFAQELEKLVPGQFEVEVLTQRDYIEKYGDIPEMAKKIAPIPGIEEGKFATQNTDVLQPVSWGENRAKWKAVWDGMRDQKFHLSQTQVTVIGGHLYDKFAALDLPFLFDSHDHLSSALDGEIGDTLCKELGETTNVKGLAFTYSGGYRVIGSNHEIGNLDELKTVDITTVPMTKTFFSKLAAKSEARNKLTIDEIAQSAADGGALETTYLRFSGKHVLKTNHSMFLTTILVGQDFFNTLTEEQQQAFAIAAKRVAKIERQWSVEDAEKYEREAVANGVTIKEVSASDVETMRSAAPAQYNSAYRVIPGSEELVKQIKSIK